MPPSSRSRPSNPSQEAPSGPKATCTPRTRARAGTRAPLLTWEAFEAAHREADDRLQTYLHRARRGSVSLDRDVATELEPAAALYLPANNRDARLRYVKIAARRLGDAIGALPENVHIFWVTLINRDHAVREDEAAAFRVKRLHSWAHQLLRGCDFVGMVEAALFTNLDVVGAGYKRTVSWHSHLLVWGVAEEVIAGICAKANARYRTLVPGVTVAHYRPVSYAEACRRAFYMHKGQISEYRVWPRRRKSMDGDTGEMTIVGTGHFSQGKRPMRPGDMARMCRVFAGRTLDRLAFGGGAGRNVLDAIRHETLAPYKQHVRREAARRASQEAIRHARQSSAASSAHRGAGL